MTVQLLLTCLCDALYGEVGIATVQVLEHCGVKVQFPEKQTCCGQPAFNSGAGSAARIALDHFSSTFDPDIPIVTPSTSCAAMLRHGAHQIAPKFKSAQVYELSEFLIDVIGIQKWPLSGSIIQGHKRVAFHSACHGRVLNLDNKPLKVLSMVPRYSFFEPDEAEQCCGFGGTFSATLGPVSAGIGLEKLRKLQDLDVELVTGTDMGCMMHLEALAKRCGIPIRFLHYSQLMAEAIS